MDNEHDKLLDDLINYYDSPDSDALGGDTTIITPPQKTPHEEILGDTLIVNTISSEDETNIRPDDDGDTIAVSVPEREEHIIPQDEIFGNLDIDGNVMPYSPRREVRRAPEIPRPQEHGTSDTQSVRRRGIWYSLKPLWATVIVCVMLVLSYSFYTADSGIVGIYKSNFSYNLSLILRVFGIEYDPSGQLPVIGSEINDFFEITASAEEETSAVTYDDIHGVKATVPFSEADTAEYKKYANGIVCVKSNYICFISKNGEIKWENETQISNPTVSVAGKYIAVAGKGSTHLCLYKGSETVFDTDVADKIKTCSVSEKGDVALVTEKEAYKGAVSVINKKGEEVFSWISGVNYVTSAAMLKSRNVAVSLVSAENSVKSYVMVFDIYDTEPVNGTEFSDSLIFGSEQRKKNAYIAADNLIASIDSHGETNYIINFDGMDIIHNAVDSKGWCAVSCTSENLPYINVYNRRGALYASVQTESVPDCIDLYKSAILYNNGRDILCGETDDIKTRYAAPMTVKNLVMINKNTYLVVYENSLQIIKL